MPYQDQFAVANTPATPYVGGRYVANPLVVWEPQDNNISFAATQFGIGTVEICPFEVPQEVYASAVAIYLSNSYSASNAGSSQAHSLTVSVGIYALSGSSLQLATYTPVGGGTSSVSASASTAFTVTGSTSSVSYQGLKASLLPIGAAGLLPGNYFFAIASSTASAGNAIAGAFSNVIQSFAGGQSVFKGYFGASTAASNQLRFGGGQYSATSSVLPASIGLSEIVGSAQGNTNNPVFNFVNYTA